jgi:D,D-heptose 1,7-bisphosphate phosphatase
MRQAVILAGGKGTRLAARLNGAPKPLVLVNGKPLLGRQLENLACQGFNHVLLLVNYRADAIREYCDTLDIPGLRVDVCLDAGGARGTAGAVSDVAKLLDDRFLVVYGDTLFDIDLDRMWRAHAAANESSGALGTLFLHPNDHPYDSDLVDMAKDGVIRAFHPKPHKPDRYYRNLVNAALYVLESAIFLQVPLPEGQVDFGNDLFPVVLDSGLSLHGYATFEYIKDIGTPDRLDRAETDLRSGTVAGRRLDRPQLAVFIDRDGTINRPAGHIASPDSLTLFEGVGNAIGQLNKAEYRCVLITNQPVLARGECTPEGLDLIHAKLETLIGHDRAYLDGIYVCPHHPHSGYSGEVRELKRACDCRKPSPGMLLLAANELSIDLGSSWMIGDSHSDIAAAQSAGVRSILVRTGGSRATAIATEPDFEVDDFVAAANFILRDRDAIRAALVPHLGRIQADSLVRIAGQSRSGKSLVASALSEMLRECGLASAQMRMDRWLLPEDVRNAVAGPGGAFDMEAIAKVVDGWSDGGALDVMMPAYQPDGPSSQGGAILRLPAHGSLLVEGTLAFGITGHADKRSLNIFVECDESVRCSRFAAEYARRGMLPDAIEALYRQRLAIEYPVVQAQRESADIVIAGIETKRSD